MKQPIEPLKNFEKPSVEKKVSKEKTRKEAISGELIKNYYKKHFNYNMLWDFINKKSFKFREFGFEVLDGFFVRNKSFETVGHLREYLSVFATKGVYSGAIYEDSVRSETRAYDSFTIHDTNWKEKELVFDLDANEYDLVRTCECKGRAVCQICWELMQDAAEIMDETLKIDFGFKEVTWVFTGGRGYHCWVNDPEALRFSQEQRSAIISYMQLINDPKGEQRVEQIKNNQILLKSRIYRLLAKNFLEKTPKKLLEELGIKSSTSTTIKNKLKQWDRKNYQDIIPRTLKEDKFFESLVRYRYARIDHKVTIDTKRLIRLPGSIHFGTGLISQKVEDPISFFPEQAKHLTDFN